MYERKKGFTLIEVVFALAVLLIGLVGVLSLFPVGLTASKKAGDYTTAALVAEQQIASMKAAGYDIYGSISTPPSKAWEKSIEPPGFDYYSSFGMSLPEGFSWSALVETTGIDNLRKVTLSIYWVDQQAGEPHRGYRVEKFVTYLAKYN